MTSLSFHNPALESAVDAYASRLLRLQSAQEAIIDPSVGPYVTSVIRSSISSDDTLSSVPEFSIESMIEYDSLMELMQEHCGMAPEVSREVLQRIALAVRTGVVGEYEETNRTWSTTSCNINDRENHHSYGYGSDGNLNAPQAMMMWNDVVSKSSSSSNLNGLTNPLTVHLGVSYSDSGNIITSEYEENSIRFEDELKFSYQEGRNRADEQKFCPSSSFSESDYYHYSTDRQVSQTVHIQQASNNTFYPSPMNTISLVKPDHLIPIDLLGESVTQIPDIRNAKLAVSIDSPSPHITQERNKGDAVLENTTLDNDEKSNMLSSNKIKGKKGKNKATDLAALLFKPSRPRSNSVQELKSPKIQSPALPVAPSSMSLSFVNGLEHVANSAPAVYRPDLESSTQILLSLNPTICEEAAYESLLISNSDINLAQHVIDGALSAPPVCRHMLNDSCYRSDCQFSHDVDGHTCLFWLKGRCGKGVGCRFLHGFSQKLLDGVNLDYVPDYFQTATGSDTGETSREANWASTSQSNPNHQPIKTANLVQHNMKTAMATTSRQVLNRSGSFDFHSSSMSSIRGVATNDGASSRLFHSSMWTSPSSTSSEAISIFTANCNIPEESNSYVGTSSRPNALHSFASIASKGYNQTSFSCDNFDSLDYSSNDQSKSFVRIPQDLWNANHNRNSSAFQIADPIARYYDVSQSLIRDDVIDLHFQSLKTFCIVLSQILPEKLRSYNEVWIVSGSGHHVNRGSHQKSGGILDNAVIEWLTANEYNFTRGKDKNGFGGAVLVKR